MPPLVAFNIERLPTPRHHLFTCADRSARINSQCAERGIEVAATVVLSPFRTQASLQHISRSDLKCPQMAHESCKDRVQCTGSATML